MVVPYRGLIAVTRDHGVRAVSIVYNNVLFATQIINDVPYSVLVREGRAVSLSGELDRYLLFARAFISIMGIVAKLTNSRYYTFLGEFRFYPERRLLVYEPYVELLKKAIIRIRDRSVTIRVGEIFKRYRRARSGLTPYVLINIVENILTLMQKLQ